MFPHGSFCLTGWSGIFLSASLYAFSSFFFCCCSAAVCSSLFWPSLPPLPPPLPCPIWACAGTASRTISAAIMKVLISVVPYGQETHVTLAFELWQIRHLDFRNRPPAIVRQSPTDVRSFPERGKGGRCYLRFVHPTNQPEH